ncbi:hypothetical protein ABEG18_11260 [Alsobacter sp. KACC 23698]|uniref:Uncharacterized protein n=1 Tax=Alsobacter sp. KACC 23698 TaxID=3149229 RepID=A0AAU7JLN4_9HYPH
MIREAQDAKTLAMQKSVARGVLAGLRLPAMLLTINFDDEASGKTAKISDVGSQGDLTAEVRGTKGDVIPYDAPQETFRNRHLAP